MTTSSNKASAPPDYTPITEVPRSPATRDQLARLFQRYDFAARLGVGRRVLEVACGAGPGLGHLARTAQRVVGGDYTENLLRVAQATYHERLPLVRLDAQQLPFADGSFEVVVLCEAIYYLPEPERFVVESRRVLEQGGTLVISSVNKDWSGFSPSAFSTRYFSLPELRDLMAKYGFQEIRCFGGFPSATRSLGQRAIAMIRRLAAGLNLIPKTLGGRARFKRLFYGPTSPLPTVIPEKMTNVQAPEPLEAKRRGDYAILYVTGARSTPLDT